MDVYEMYSEELKKSIIKHGTVPHCDSNILHPPTKCDYCDERTELQEARIALKINFTGEYDKDKAICPAEMVRNLPKIERWYGNVPWKNQYNFGENI